SRTMHRYSASALISLAARISSVKRGALRCSGPLVASAGEAGAVSWRSDARMVSSVIGGRTAPSSVHRFKPCGFTAILVSECLSPPDVEFPPPRRMERIQCFSSVSLDTRGSVLPHPRVHLWLGRAQPRNYSATAKDYCAATAWCGWPDSNRHEQGSGDFKSPASTIPPHPQRRGRSGRRAVLPVAPRSQFGAVGQRGELGPDHLGIEIPAAGVNREAAVDTGHHPLAA